MITYLAIRLSNGDYYWGSTSMALRKRERFHRKQSSNDHFHNSLRKYPEDWVFVEVFTEETKSRSTERLMLLLHCGRKGCLNISNEPQGWGSGENHARNLKPELWEHLKGEGHPRVKDPGKWVNAMGKNHWTKRADPHVLRELGNRLPVMSGDSNHMKNPEVSKKVSKWRQNKSTEAWLKADFIYDCWIAAGKPKPSAKAWAKATSFPPSKLRTMVASFIEGWIPCEDEEWFSWKASLPQ